MSYTAEVDLLFPNSESPRRRAIRADLTTVIFRPLALCDTREQAEQRLSFYLANPEPGYEVVESCIVEFEGVNNFCEPPPGSS